jgi:general secretion pathway protein H
MKQHMAVKNTVPSTHAPAYVRREDVSCNRSVVGFTLVELMIVIVILAIAAAVVVPMASSAGGTQIRAAANMVAADLEYAKSMAISRGTQYGYAVRFDKVNETYQIEDNSKPVGDPDRVIDHPVRKGSKYVVAFGSDGRLDRVDIADASFDGTSVVIFNYLGSPFNGSGLGSPLNNGVVTLQASGVTRSVNVEPVTGFVSISD